MIDVYWLEQTATEVRHEDDLLSARELGLLDHLHIPKRNADWRLGRWTAKRALAVYLDLPDQYGPNLVSALPASTARWIST